MRRDLNGKTLLKRSLRYYAELPIAKAAYGIALSYLREKWGGFRGWF
tara:strand:- start:634 stop:774 length:141 start_codon:yes stop_codon:yes gene_type:complete